MDNINLKVKLYLENEHEKFMGIGVLWVLQRVSSCGSLRAAAAEMGISYSKAFRMVDTLEKTLGVPVLERHRGGMQRSGAKLTPFGQAFILLYDDFQRKCKTLMDEPFEKFSKELSL
ncbi:MAG: LysR family transcriptional regulator, partial [Bacteroidales bacterium]|nr:LysR family transcriptional regulator [Bacteroidales bacterium]